MIGVKNSQVFSPQDIERISNGEQVYPICVTNGHPLAQSTVHTGERLTGSEMGWPVPGDETCLLGMLF